MRKLGYRAVDEIVGHLRSLADRPVGCLPDRDRLEALLDVEIPCQPRAPADVLDDVVRDVLGATVQTDHPRFMAYVPGPSTYVGAVADFLASGFNVFAGQWLVGSGPAVVERVTIDWFRLLCGLPETAGGLFVSGGTMANLVAIHAARRRHPGPAAETVIYLTRHTHASIRRGLRFLGVQDGQVRLVEVDDAQRMSVADLHAKLAASRREGHRPCCVIATAGTTSTGTVDPLDELAELSAASGVWLHVDAAYGAAAVLSPSSSHLLRGLGRADSIALDPHKWWYQPYEAGCVLVRDATMLTDAFAMDAEYLRETRLGHGPLNYYDYGPQLTRSFRALKVWMSLHTFGLDAFRQAVEHSIALAEHAQTMIGARRQWEVVTPAQLAILTFRPHAAELSDDQVDALTRRIAAGTLADGYAMVTTTELNARPVLRLCLTNPETTTEDVDRTIDMLERLARS